ncbi:MAG: M55 family metallopeptidase [Cyclobacteriaceae bacterium]|nr:M55 family metallopeptidase [Cyclobacteriaceae bacterium]
MLIYHDMEGLSGEDDWRMFSFSHPEQYAVGRELLTADINAVVEGLVRGGASLIKVVDAHGSGNQEPDVLMDKLDKRASMFSRDTPFRQYVDIVEANSFDAIVCVGMHAKTGSGGFASHTFTLGMDIIMNDRSITETELVGYSWGRVGVPVVMVSGDDKLANDLKVMPWIEYVTVKKATSASTAELRPVAEARMDLTAAAERALRKLGTMQVMKLKEPVQAALRVVAPASLDRLKNFPGITYQDQMARFTAPDFGKAYDGVIALISVATAGYMSVTTEVVKRQPNGKELQLEIGDALNMRWLDVESGRWKPEPVVPAAPRKYYGAR